MICSQLVGAKLRLNRGTSRSLDRERSDVAARSLVRVHMSMPSDRIDRLDERRERMRKFTKQPASPPALQAQGAQTLYQQ